MPPMGSLEKALGRWRLRKRPGTRAAWISSPRRRPWKEAAQTEAQAWRRGSGTGLGVLVPLCLYLHVTVSSSPAAANLPDLADHRLAAAALASLPSLGPGFRLERGAHSCRPPGTGREAAKVRPRGYRLVLASKPLLASPWKRALI